MIASADTRPRGRYIPALDGIRALAVAAVILYHLNPSLAPGGMQGVTVFFVLSGFLITHLLIVEFDGSGRIDLKGFWRRRLKRLAPAIVVVVVVTAALCTGFNHVMLTKMRPDILPSMLFVNNWWQIFNQQSYFNAVGDPSPLTHFWSLAIEMQFYLVWPVALMIALRNGVPRKRIGRATLALAALSALEMALLYDPAVDPSRVYYGTDTRAFSLLLGAWLAIAPRTEIANAIRGALRGLPEDARSTRDEHAPVMKIQLVDLLGIAGLAGTLALMAFTNGYSAFPYRGGILLASLFSLMLVCACASGRGIAGRLFAWKPLVWLGQRSYVIYLWHYPLLLLMNPASDVSSKPWWIYALQVAVVIAVSEASYRFIETPFRRGAFGAVARRLRDDRDSIPSWAKRHAVPLTLAGATCLVALGGIALVPPTSALSEEGSALLQGGEPAQDGHADTANMPEGAFDITMIGDSVSLRAVDAFMRTFPHGHIDVAMNRQFTAGIEIYRGLVEQGQAGRVAVFALGTNGPFSSQDVDELMSLAGKGRIVVFVNNRAARPWCEPNNQVLADAAGRYGNIRLVDWYGESADRGELFDGDGIHLSDAGAEEYIGLIDHQVRMFLPLHPEDGGDPRLLAAQHALDGLKQACTPRLGPIATE